MITNSGSVLILCHGNSGRLDDGLGAAFAEKVKDKAHSASLACLGHGVGPSNSGLVNRGVHRSPAEHWQRAPIRLGVRTR
jgi:hypothetical protein